MVTQIGRLATTRGAARPAFCAAVMIGTVCDSSVAGPVIQVAVPSVTEPAELEHLRAQRGNDDRARRTSATRSRVRGDGLAV